MLEHITEEVIDYNDFAIPISDIAENMKNIVIAGRIAEIYEKRDFVKKDGTFLPEQIFSSNNYVSFKQKESVDDL